MSLVGDIIMELRSRIPDAPMVAPNPVVTIAAVNTPGAFLPQNVNYYIQGTQYNSWGESASPVEQLVLLTAPNNSIQITFTNVTNAVRAYWGNNSGGEINVLQGNPPVMPINGSATLVLGAPAGSGYMSYIARPPTRSTAFEPDSDGNFIGSATAFRQLNRALQEMVKIAGGIVDVTGVRSTINTSMYRLASPFYTFVNAWFDGYPMDVVPRSFMYLRNSAAGFSGILSYEQDGPQSVIQVWPQSNRTGGSNSLYQVMGASDNFFLVNNYIGFLSIGLAQIDNEIVGYSLITPQPGVGPTVATFGGVVRGLGGTDIVQHQTGAPVIELNIRLSGYRLAKQYNVGDSAQTLMVPPAWEGPLVKHMLSQVRSMEQDDATAEKLYGEFVQDTEKIAKASRLGRIKPRQIPVWGQNTSDSRNVNGIGFGWLIN
jgi:hypothetical protein